MTVHSLTQNALFKALTKPVSREAEAFLAGAVVGVLLLMLALSHNTPEQSDLPSDVSIEGPEAASPDADQNVPVRQRY